ncbi:MAG TPA: ChaN family lipoprotein [Chthoniobacterales bacterium]|nr:ChaN family lipoprotein [Chthoniobacterales bacterium]
MRKNSLHRRQIFEDLPAMQTSNMKRWWLFPALFTFFSSCAFRSGEKSAVVSQSDTEFWRGVSLADVIYVGEMHGDRNNHEYELDLIRGMIRRGMHFAVGWEMFDQSQQTDLDRFNQHKLTLDDLVTQTGFEKSWGKYSPLYAEILRTTGKSRVRNVALNAPASLAHKIARGEPLSAQERNEVPTGFTVPTGAYQNFVQMLGDHPGMEESDLSLFFAAQNLWDQTMAQSILRFRQKNPKMKLLVLTGRGHVKGGFGIPNYVSQKSSTKQLVLFPPAANDIANGQKAI